MNTYCASAPGKILWLGGYSVLERGNVSLVTVVNKRVYARWEPGDGGGVVFVIPQFKVKIRGKIKNGKLGIGASKEEKNKAKFVIAAAESCIKYLAAKGKKIKGFALTTISDRAFGTGKEKTGLGSSAAVTVASVAAIMGAFGHGADSARNKQIINNIAQVAHSQAQGKVGSGFDIAAATYGTINYSRYSPEMVARANALKGKGFAASIERGWDYSIEPVSLPDDFIPVLAFTNVPASTSEMVKKLLEFKGRKRRTYSRMISEINAANGDAIKSLSQISENRNAALLQFRNHFNEARLLTKKLGELAGADIENPRFTKLIQLSLQKGAFVCKLPGAGGGDSIAAICLNGKDALKLRNFWKSIGLKLLEVGFGDGGVREENAAAVEKMPKTNA